MWAEVSPLTFTKSQSESVDIEISFESYKHSQDNGAFDGPWGVLAHAFFPSSYPIGGDIHMDDSEPWSVTYQVKMTYLTRILS